MLWIIRVGAYLVSGFTIWRFFYGGADWSAAHHLALAPAQGMVLGVCAGFSNYTGLDVTVIRLAWVLSCFYKGIGILLYLLAFIIMPSA